MGLSVVHGIIKSHGGYIQVQSEQGKGSTFRVYFPTMEMHAEFESQEKEPVPTGNEHILFVDDEPTLTDIAKHSFESLGYKVTTRTSSVEALQLFKSQPDIYDLVITDMTMPKMTGDILAREIMLIRPDIPVILCTGYSARINEGQAMALGIRSYLNKPIEESQFATTIRTVLDGK